MKILGFSYISSRHGDCGSDDPIFEENGITQNRPHKDEFHLITLGMYLSPCVEVYWKW